MYVILLFPYMLLKWMLILFRNITYMFAYYKKILYICCRKTCKHLK